MSDISCVVDSRGNVVNTVGKDVVYSICEPKQRVDELFAFIKSMADHFQWSGLPTSSALAFTYKYQAESTQDAVYAFLKVPIRAEDPFVHTAFEFSKQPMPNNPTPEQRLLRSVYSEQVRGQNLWYILYAQEILLERNLFDKEWERMTYSTPMLYYDFKKMVSRDKEAAAKHESVKVYTYPDNQDYEDPRELIPMFINMNNWGKPITKIPVEIQKGIQLYRATVKFDERCEHGNEASFFLHLINDCRYTDKKAFFDIFKQIRNMVKKDLPDPRYIHYADGNIIFHEYDGAPPQTVYVCEPISETDQFSLVLNGKVYTGTQDLRKHLLEAIRPCKWFNSIVAANITKDRHEERGITE